MRKMGRYDDIINHERYVLQYNKPMSMHDRVAQFSSFKALEGFESEIAESGRLTDSRAVMTEDEIAELDSNFSHLVNMEHENPKVEIEYFQSDERKNGGRYERFIGKFRFFDESENILRFTDGTEIKVESVTKIRFI